MNRLTLLITVWLMCLISAAAAPGLNFNALTLHGVTIGMNAEQVTKQLGAPQKNVKTSGLEIWEYGQSVPWSVVTFSDQRLASIWGTVLRSKGLEVVKVGDSQASVKTLLGKPDLVSRKPRMDVIWAYYKKDTIRIRWSQAGLVKGVGLEDAKWAKNLPKGDFK